MAMVQVLAGPQSPERTKQLDSLLHEHWGHALLLTPTGQLARRRLEALLAESDAPGVWGRPVMTLQSFAESILQDADADTVRLNDVERRLMLRDVLAQLQASGKLDAAGPAAGLDGFVNHLLRVIEMLKQAAVEPEDFREQINARRHPSPLDGVVAEAYQAYQDRLIESRAYDMIGVYWQARRILEEKQDIKLLKDIELIAFDGFDDFTESEFQLIAALAQRVPRLAFALRMDARPEAADLYALQRRTLERLETTFQASVERLDASPPSTFCDYASTYLLWRGGAPSFESLERNIEVVPCAGVTEEAETIFRKAKTLILENVPASEIAVVYHDIGAVSGVLRSVARAFGIPLRLAERESLSASSVAAFVLDALEAADAWRHGEMAELLASPWMDADGASELERGAIPLLVRLAGIVAGYKQWTERLKHLRSGLTSDTPERASETQQFVRRNPRALEGLSALEKRVERLATAVSRLPLQGNLAEFSRAVAGFIKDLELRTALHKMRSEVVRAREKAALDTFEALLGRLSAGWFGGGSEVTRADFMQFLRQACGAETFRTEPNPRDKHGVQCFDARALRGLRFRYVFFGGLNEGVIPRRESVNAVYSEDDRRELRAAGIPVESREVRGERELAWFHQTLETAGDRMWLFWRTATAQGRPLLRSPFLNDLLRLFPDARIERPPMLASEYYPPIEEAGSARDILNACYATRAGMPEPLMAEHGHVMRGAAVEQRRYSSAPFDTFDGMLSGSPLEEKIAEKYDDDRVFSATQLEMYRTCPFRFFAMRLLRLLVVERPEAAFDRREVGSLVHDVLEAFHRRYEGLPVADIPEDEALNAMAELTDEAFARYQGRTTILPAGLLAAGRLETHGRMKRYLEVEREVERKEKERWRPRHFEAIFGGEDGAYPPLAIETEAGNIQLRGRIDRIDEGKDGFRVIDYKTGALAKAEDIRLGVALQLTAYGLALEQVIAQGATCVESLFLQVGTRDKRRIRNAPRNLSWDVAREGFLAGVAAALTGIRAAQYPPVPHSDNACANCDARRMCRIDRSRIERKQEQG